jgi:plasmid maintenance system antidote protein VapI
MTTIRTIRRENLLAQIAQFSSQREFAEKAGLAPAHVSQMVTERRNMGDEVARRIEKNLNLADGHMDLQHQPQGYAFESPVRNRNRVAESDAETLKALLQKLERMQRRLTPKTRQVIIRIERAAIEGRLSDEDWGMLERLVERFERR